jgi:uncharacterized protein
MLLDYFIFQGVSLQQKHVFAFDFPYEEVFISTIDNEVINALLFKPVIPSKGLVIYFHGNADNLQRWGEYAIDLTQLGYEVLMMDYRGYGKSTGKPGEDVLYNDARAVWLWSRENLEVDRLVLYGRSLGTAVAAQLAMEANPSHLILETPFDEIRGAMHPIARNLLSIFSNKNVFPTKSFLANLECPKIIFHGTKDRIVPLDSALKLKPLLAETDQFVVIQNGKHGDLRNYDLYHQKLAEALG